MKKLLIIIPYANIYPPENGGMLRCFNILNQLALHYTVTAIIFQSLNEIKSAFKEFSALEKVTFLSTFKQPKFKDIFSVLPLKLQQALRYRWLKQRLIGSSDSNFLEYYNALVMALRSCQFDFIVLENLATLNAVSVIRRFDKTVKIIYDAHNFDTHLAEVNFEKGFLSRKSVIAIKKIESNLYKQVQMVWTCSDFDKALFTSANKALLPCVTIPNGVVLGKTYNTTVTNDHSAVLLFCGSIGYSPNEEGLLWFFNHCWYHLKAQYSDIKLIIIGAGTLSEKLAVTIKTLGVEFYGRVADVKPYYDKATICIVPLLSGSGTRLKVLEAMSLGVPIVSTSKGAEGINYTEAVNIMIGDEPDQFIAAILSLLKNKDKRVFIQHNARDLVSNTYDWNNIGKLIIQSFQLI